MTLSSMLALLLLAAPTPDPRAEFEAWTGAKLVFTRAETPEEVLYATTPTLDAKGRERAAHILAREARRYPRGLFAKVGLHTVAVFRGCGDPDGDGFRPWVDWLEGYRYFGRWDPVGALAACYYDDAQLPLTFHHEVFHHLDATVGGRTSYSHFAADDERFTEAVTGQRPYRALKLEPRLAEALRAASTGEILEEAVGHYAAKSQGEDQAETARWLQGHLADGLLQAAYRPELPGSQRILHLLAEYRRASPLLTTEWWIGVALAGLLEPEAQRAPSGGVAPPPVAQVPDNPYLAKVDEALDDPALAATIRQVQPAAVKIGNGSGVNLAPDGLVLTNAHVAERVGDRFTVLFPDGRRFAGVTTASNHHHDLALVALEDASDLPFARLAPAAPEVGDTVVCIGQPGTRTPSGEATGYQPWHVSVGQIRGFLPDILGRQSLGRTKHDAWTYWGHSGSPLFDVNGRIVALHNSWDSKTAMRHAVPWQAIRAFLDASLER